MLVGLGWDKTLVENAWEKFSTFMYVFDIPVDKALACTIYSVANKCSIFVPLKDICGVDMGEMEKMITSLEKTQKYCEGMAIKYLGECIDIAGKYLRGEITDED